MTVPNEDTKMYYGDSDSLSFSQQLQYSKVKLVLLFLQGFYDTARHSRWNTLGLGLGPFRPSVRPSVCSRWPFRRGKGFVSDPVSVSVCLCFGLCVCV